MKLKAGVIGIGSMGMHHVRILSGLDQVELISVADKNKSSLENAEKKYKIRTYDDYKEMINKENLDFICISVPTNLHKEVAIACCEKKINVLVEKPIASNSEEAKEIIDAAKRNNVLLTVGHLERFNPAVLELKKKLMNNELGTVYKIEADRLGPYPLGRIKDSGVVIDLAVHDLDIFRFLMDAGVTRIHAETEKRIHSTNEDLLLALLKFDNNVLGVVDVNWLTPMKKRRLCIVGEKGMFEVDYINQSLRYYENSYVATGGDSPFSISEGRMIKYFIEKKEPLQSEIENFIDCIKNKKEPVVTGEDGLRALMLAELIIKSANNKEVLNLG